MMSTLFWKLFSLFLPFWGFFFFFLVFHVTLSVLMIKKWNFAVIFTANDTWVVKRLNAWLIVEKPVMTFSAFWMVTGWRHIWSWWVNYIDLSANPSLSSNCWVSYCWPVGCIKREQNDINIARPSIHKTAISGRISEMIFSSFSWTYLLFIIHTPGLDK